jgi:hypothetical protein
MQAGVCVCTPGQLPQYSICGSGCVPGGCVCVWILSAGMCFVWWFGVVVTVVVVDNSVHLWLPTFKG